MRSLKLAIIVILEIVVGGIVFLGGTALTVFAMNKVLGIIHAGLGLFAFPVAYGIWKRDAWAWNAALGLNLLSIAYSIVSETIVISGVLLPPADLQDSSIGTIVAVMISIAIVILLVIFGKRRLFR